MTTFRLKRPNFSSFSLSIAFLRQPFLVLLFLFFLTSSADLLHVYLLIFKIKMTNAIALMLFTTFFLTHVLQVHKESFILTLAILGAMLLSLQNSPNLTASIGAIFFFIFNYFFYFLISYNQFKFFDSEKILKIYSFSFYCTGIYALCQVLLPFAGIILPGNVQLLGKIVRGSAFTYEPSYYALYMTPFVFYKTSNFLLSNPSNRKFQEVFWPNFFFLLSTSTGCFFSYLFFLLTLFLFKKLKIININLKRTIKNSTILFTTTLCIIWSFNKQIIRIGLLKFFYGSGFIHFSVLDRWRGITDYWNMFLEHPLNGVSFGGGPFYLSKKIGNNNLDATDPNILILYSPMNVTTEVLASVGIIGAICFMIFFYLLIRNFILVLHIQSITEKEKKSLISFGLSICVMFFTLQFNQSIMRSYMWIHVGLFFGYTTYLSKKYAYITNSPQNLALNSTTLKR